MAWLRGGRANYDVFGGAVQSYTNDFWREKYTAVYRGGSIPVSSTAAPDPVKGIVKAEGIHFTVDGKKFYFSGTNAYYLIMPDLTEYAEIETFFRVRMKTPSSDIARPSFQIEEVIS
jgi:hypothetical protein